MSNSTTTHAWVTRVALRISSSSGLIDEFPSLADEIREFSGGAGARPLR